MKKKLAVFLVLVFALSLCAAGCGNSGKVTINVLNWGDYIDEDLLDQFTEETGIEVNYQTMATNEEMLVKLEASDCIYDVCFPSDYVIEKLIEKDLLHELNKENIPNLANIDERFLDLSFDPENKYSVPYMWGTVGILYNTTMVDEPITHWAQLFDTKYANNVIMMDSYRDTLGLVLKMQGYSMNERSEEALGEARDILIKQKQDGIVKAYQLDETKDKMIAGEAALAVVYSGDALYAMEGSEDLAYVVPMEGSNIWLDGMCIPKESKNPEAAMVFIDYMCRPDIARMNMDYIWYSTPIQAVIDGMSEEESSNETLNPPQDVIDRCEFFNDVGEDVYLYEEIWSEVRLAR